MRAEIARMQREVRATTIYVTHDQVEAMTMGDRVAVLRKGELEQVDTPQRLYSRPAKADGGGLLCRLGEQALDLPDETIARPELRGWADRTLGLGIRPEHLQDAACADGARAARRLRRRVVTTEPLGSVLPHVEVAAPPVVTEERSGFVGRFDARSAVRAVDEVEMAVDTGHLRFFDLETELALGAEQGASS